MREVNEDKVKMKKTKTTFVQLGEEEEEVCILNDFVGHYGHLTLEPSI